MKANSQSTNQQEETIKQVWNYLLKEGDPVIELRGIHPEGSPPKVQHFRDSNYSSFAELKTAFEEQALALNNQGYNVYTLLNPIKPDFCGNAAKDQDVQSRRLLLIDIDRSGDTKQPATEGEVEHAKSLAQEVSTYLGTLGWPDPTRMMSGNGVHLYYRLADLENNTSSKALIKRTLINLAGRFNMLESNIDTTVFNASRITKVPGTISRKGVNSDYRPYRMTEVY